jgi:glycosyltransferase involved in cell wall biosynthesis
MYGKPVVVIMSVYKADKPQYLKEAIVSIREQTYENISLYLAKDGPLGNELESVIIEEEKLWGSRINVYSFKNNKGLSVRLNFLINKIINNYEYVIRMDSDDISISDRVESQLIYMENNKEVDIVGGSIIEIDENGKNINRVVYTQNYDKMIRKFVIKNIVAHTTVMFRTSYFLKAGLYPNTFRSWSKCALPVEDTRMWLNGLVNGCNFANLNKDLTIVRTSRDFFYRRGGLQLALVEYGIRNQIVSKLNLPFYYYGHAFIFFIVRVLPASIKKIIWRFR